MNFSFHIQTKFIYIPSTIKIHKILRILLLLSKLGFKGSTENFCNFSKGQLISKGVLMSSISSKKLTKEFNFTTMIPQVDLFSFVFWRKPKTPKKPFRNYLTFSYYLALHLKEEFQIRGCDKTPTKNHETDELFCK